MNAVSATNVADGSPTDTNSVGFDCSVETLPVPQGTDASWVTAVSPDGRYVAGRTLFDDFYGGQEIRPIVWVDGEYYGFVDLPHQAPIMNGISSDGQAVVTVTVPLNDGEATVNSYSWAENDVISLEDDLPSQGLGINEHHDMVGVIQSPGTENFHAVTFGEDGHERLDEPEDVHESLANDIDDDGTIVGSVTNEDERVPYRWNAAGLGTELTLEDVNLQPATSVNDGWVVANGVHTDDGRVAAYWAPGQTEGTAIEFDQVSRINSEGWITGVHNDAAAVIVDQEVISLPSPNDDPDLADRAQDMSSDGSVIGGAVNRSQGGDDTREAAIWNCS